MKRFVQSETRSQMSLLPECLDDYITEDNPVRVVDGFIDALDLEKLGFAGMVPQVTGRPGYHLINDAEALRLRLPQYVYGYLNTSTVTSIECIQVDVWNASVSAMLN